jgi:amidase
MARDVGGVAAGMALLEPGFAVDVPPASRLGRIRPAGIDVDPAIDLAVDAALARSGLTVTDASLPGWLTARDTCGVILDAEAAESDRELLTDPVKRDLLGAEVLARLDGAAAVTPDQLAAARAARPAWRDSMTKALSDVDLLVLPTVPFYPPLLADTRGVHFTAFTNPVNLAGFPAVALPVPSTHRLPASLQLIGPPGSEALLLATAAIVEAAAGFVR